MSKFSRVGIRQDGNFLGSFQVVHLKGLSLDGIVVIVKTLNKEIVGARASSIDGKTKTIGKVLRVARLNDPRFCQHQRYWIEIPYWDRLNFFI